jgi:hypothetical protein
MSDYKHSKKTIVASGGSIYAVVMRDLRKWHAFMPASSGRPTAQNSVCSNSCVHRPADTAGKRTDAFVRSQTLGIIVRCWDSGVLDQAQSGAIPKLLAEEEAKLNGIRATPAAEWGVRQEAGAGGLR